MQMKYFDFVNYHVTERDSLHDKLHVHNDSYEIMQITEGEGFFVIGGTPYPIIPGAIYLTNAVHLHCSRPKETAPYVRSKLAVNAPYLDRVLEVLGLSHVLSSLFGSHGGSCIPLPPHIAEHVDRGFKMMYDSYAEKTPETNARIMVELLDILLLCYSHVPKEHTDKQKGTSLIARTINYINLNISSELTIDSIARDNFVSKYYLCRVFKKTLGVSIMKYILSQRLALAKEQLVNTETRCSDIAMLTGFSSFSYFCRTFKQQEGVSPSQYRVLHKKQ